MASDDHNFNIIIVNIITVFKEAHLLVSCSKYPKERWVLSLLFNLQKLTQHKKYTEFLLVASMGVGLEVNLN